MTKAPLLRALDLQHVALNGCAELFTQTHSILVAAALGQIDEQQAVDDLIAVYNSRTYYDTEKAMMKAAGSYVITVALSGLKPPPRKRTPKKNAKDT